MKKLFGTLVISLGLAGCATTHTTDEIVVRNAAPRVIYVTPHDPMLRHHYWHWGWHHRHGWGTHYPHFYHPPRHIPPHRHNDQRKVVPNPVNPGNGSHVPRNEHLK